MVHVKHGSPFEWAALIFTACLMDLVEAGT